MGGFLGSTTTHVEARFYSLQRDHRRLLSDNVVQRAELVCDGTNERSPRPAVIAVRTLNSLGTAGGNFEVTLKPGLIEPRDLRDVIIEDDWCDIIFFQHGRPFHTYRGQVDTVLRNRRVSAGATEVTFTISGRGFGKPFEVTPIWFDRFSEGDYVGFAASRLWNEEHDFFNGPPDETVKSILYGFLRQLRTTERGVIEIPQMPGEPSTVFGDITVGEGDIVASQFVAEAYSNTPARRSGIYPPAFNPGDSYLWQLAQAWADPTLCELYCDLGPVGDATENGAGERTDANIYFTPETPIPLGSARMYVYFRDRPFPTVSRLDADGNDPGNLNGLDGPWFRSIPRYDIPFNAVFDDSTARSGIERRNAFFVTPRLFQEVIGSAALALARPLIDLEDIQTHGMRRLEVTTRYSAPTDGRVGDLIPRYRAIVRDFFAINDLLLSGTIVIRPGRPDIRIGGRLRVFEPVRTSQERASRADPEAYTTYYVESVTHEWSRPQGLVTICQVSRGWRGSDESLADAISTLESGYREPELFDSAEGESPDGAQVQDPPDSPSTAHLVTLTESSNFATTEGGRVIPGSAAFRALFEQAAAQAGVPTVWARYRSLERLVSVESRGGWVGIPNFTYGERSMQRHRWPEVWAELRSGELTSNTVEIGGTRFERSSATGLGQLILPNVDIYYPGGSVAERRAGIGFALPEAVGMLNYIQDRYGNPNVAWQTWQQNKTVDGFRWY